jgi:DNA-binding IclR family transcriptional regulator
MCANRERRTIKALERSLEIIDAIRELDGARVTELAEYLGYPASTVHSHLATLRDNEYLTKEGDV